MNIYERFIEQMRKAGTYYNDPAIQLGKVMVGGKINVGDLLIQKEDYLMDCNLRLNTNEKIYLHTKKMVLLRIYRNIKRTFFTRVIKFLL